VERPLERERRDEGVGLTIPKGAALDDPCAPGACETPEPAEADDHARRSRDVRGGGLTSCEHARDRSDLLRRGGQRRRSGGLDELEGHAGA
jgi:hypothetical protein